MSSAKHTPGPWATSPSRDGSHDIGIVGAGHEPKRNIVLLAECFSDIRRAHEYANEECIANARLIAAAPELLEALRQSANMLSAIAGDIEDGYSIDSLRYKYLMAVVNARDTARATLIQAEG